MSPAVTRPASRRSSAGGGGATARASAPAPPGRFTGRAVILGVVLLALLLSYVFPVRVYLAQQAEIAELRASQSQQRAYVDELAAEMALWADDEYIRIQARKRLYFGVPGELLLVTDWGDEDLPPAGGTEPGAVPAAPGAWWDTLWGSVESANGTGATPEDDPEAGP